MPFNRSMTCLVIILVLGIFLWQPAVAGVPLSVGGDGQNLPSLSTLLDRVTPGVVNIAVRGHVATQPNPLFDDPFFRRFFGVPGQLPSQKREFRAAGSGVIVDAAEGYIITNNHVVENADEITVTLRDKRQLKAKRIGVDPEADVAVIQVKSDNLTAVPLGDSDKLKVGDFVIAVGNPFGLGQTVTSGIVSALGRSGLGIEGYEDFIQTDASINPGNSGGALVNLRGELIGINTAIVGPGGGNVGIGFAIPINMARAIMDQLIRHGEVRRGLLGVQIQDLTPDIAAALGTDATSGAVVAKVEPGTAAEKAGIKAGDVITAINGEAVSDAADLRNKVGLARVGDTVKLTVLRENKKLYLSAVLTPRQQARVESGALDPRLAGAVFGAIEQDSPLFGRVNGVEVLEVQTGSRAWQAGLRKGDVILSVNQKSVKTPQELAEAARANKTVLLLNLRRGDGALFIAIR
ncbi:MAG: DegQ family serine endoprotease [Alphaproteobacteria bacterium]